MLLLGALYVSPAPLPLPATPSSASPAAEDKSEDHDGRRIAAGIDILQQSNSQLATGSSKLRQKKTF